MRVVLFVFQGAGAIDQETADSYARRGHPQQLGLRARENGQVRMTEAPARIGVATERARSSARHVEQYGVERVHGGRSGIHGHESDGSRIESIEILGHAPKSRQGAVGGDDEVRAARQFERLPAGRGAEVPDDRAGRKRRITSDECRGRVLDEALPLAPRGKFQQRRALGELETIRRQRDILGYHAAALE